MTTMNYVAHLYMNSALLPASFASTQPN